MAWLHVIKAGLLTTVQDLGRWGLQSRGVPVAGPMDVFSHRLANLLAGNDADAATLEVTLEGPELEFDDERLVAIAGAEFELTVDGRPAAMCAALGVASGSRLRLGRRSRGARAYVAIAGGISLPKIFGSRATHLISAMGGLQGRALKGGDQLPLGDPGRPPRTPRAAPRPPSLTMPEGRATVRVLPGPQQQYFATGAIDALQSAPYTIAASSDRMGFRLEGPALAHIRGADIISDATPLGVLQVPASGQPILLMADRQTAGGYPKIATTISADISLAGQLGPGDMISFAVCSPREAMAALIAQERALMAIEAAAGP
jgi:antagonist of KipI